MQIFFKIFNKLKKIKVNLFIAVLLILVLGFTSYAFAADKITKTIGDYQKGLSDSTGQNKQSFDFQSFVGVGASIVTLGYGCEDSTCPTQLKTGALYMTGDTIAMLYKQPPASGIYYALELGKKLNFATPAYAQTAGFGFDAFKPFLDMWRGVRNITYILFVIFMVFLGFMIMLRTKISPQLVMTVQAALPRAIVALILITFSYAIVGFVIDIMYILMALVVWGLQPTVGYDAQREFNQFTNSSIWNTAGFVLDRGFAGTWDLITSGPALATTGVGAGLAGIIAVTALLIPAVGATALTALASASVTSLPMLLGLVFVVIFFLFRILFSLAKTYLTLLLYLIFGPIFILWGAITGNGIWNTWLKTVVSTTTVFFVFGIIVFITKIIIDVIGSTGNSVWGAPYIGQESNILKAIVSLGALMILPNVPDIVNQMFNIKAFDIPMPSAGRQFSAIQENISKSLAPKPPR